MNRFKDTLRTKREFVRSYELVPARGARGAKHKALIDFVDQAQRSGLLHAVSLTDNPGGNPALCPDVLGAEIKDMGMDSIVHFSCKDESRNSVESRAFALERSGVENILAMTGDYPVTGYRSLSKPVFDLDSVHLLHYLKEMNKGLKVDGRGTRPIRLARTHFFLGAVVSPFKRTESDTLNQYYKLEKKVWAGAQYVITQLGYDVRKFHELLQYIRMRGLDIRVIGSVYVLTPGVAGAMNRGDIPGCVVTDDLLAEIRRERRNKDKGKAARLERAAQQVAMLKGLGYDGAHIEGHGLTFDDVATLVGRAEDIGDDWRSYADRFHYAPMDTFYLFEESREFSIREDPEVMLPQRKIPTPVGFNLMRGMHRLFFKEGTRGYRAMRKVTEWIGEQGPFYRLLYRGERVLKAVFFECRDCGDCAVPEMQFLCPESQCPKFQRNGACGGSSDSRCEVFKDRSCVWHPVYERAKAKGELDLLRSYVVPPRDWALYQTSSWINFYLRKDHTGKPMKQDGRKRS